LHLWSEWKTKTNRSEGDAMETMTPIEGSRQQVLTRIRNRAEKLDTTMADIMRNVLRTNDAELQIRVERAKKSAAEKGEALETLLDESENVAEEAWDETKQKLEAAWQEYKEAVDRARLDLERAEELS